MSLHQFVICFFLLLPCGTFGDSMELRKRNQTNSILENMGADRGREARNGCVCGVPKICKRIVGGKDTCRDEYSWMVAIVKKRSDTPRCSGSIMTSRHILTSKTCLDKPFSVYLGAYQSHISENDPPPKKLEVLKLYKWGKEDQRATGFTNIYRCNIAIIVLKEPIVFDGNIRPLCFPPTWVKSKKFFDTEAIVTGWGQTDERLSERPNVLQAVAVNTMTNKRCNDLYENSTTFRPVSCDMMCAAGDGKDACFFDGGGPLMMLAKKKKKPRFLFLIGFVSWGVGCAREGLPGVYTYFRKFEKSVRMVINKPIEGPAYVTCPPPS
ncbi:serine protease 27-like [Oratosquilla oratoria]|uniref:serine protease 27-like n=1 Tax=Oratosquilla oratoria TaxID=337810 RepID=UPI003F778204